MSPAILILFAAVAFSLYAYAVRHIASCVVYEYQKGLLYRKGKFVKMLDAGRYRYCKKTRSITVIDTRPLQMLLPGQDVLTKDNINIKISFAGFYLIKDPLKAIQSSSGYQMHLYTLAQLRIREAVSACTLEELLQAKNTLSDTLMQALQADAQAIGIEISALAVRDIMLPPALKRNYAGVLEARKEAEIQLERARGEMAVLRNLANSARMLDENPGLYQMRIIQALSNQQSIIAFGTDIEKASLIRSVKK